MNKILFLIVSFNFKLDAIEKLQNLKQIYGVGAITAAEQRDMHVPKAVLHDANAGTAAICAPGTVPNTNPAAEKHAHTTSAQPA